jgi:hypothetical protein
MTKIPLETSKMITIRGILDILMFLRYFGHFRGLRDSKGYFGQFIGFDDIWSFLIIFLIVIMYGNVVVK